MPINMKNNTKTNKKMSKQVVEATKRDFNNVAGFEAFSRSKMDIDEKVRIKNDGSYKDITLGKEVFKMMGEPYGIQIIPYKDEIILGANLIPNAQNIPLKDNGKNKKIQDKQLINDIIYHYDLEESHKYIVFSNITFEKDEKENINVVINMKEGVSYE